MILLKCSDIRRKRQEACNIQEISWALANRNCESEWGQWLNGSNTYFMLWASPHLKWEIDSNEWCLIVQPLTFIFQLMELVGFNDLYYYSLKLDWAGVILQHYRLNYTEQCGLFLTCNLWHKITVSLFFHHKTLLVVKFMNIFVLFSIKEFFPHFQFLALLFPPLPILNEEIVCHCIPKSILP